MMTRNEFDRLPRFLSTQDTDEAQEVVAISCFGILPLTHCSETQEGPAAEPIPDSLPSDGMLFATQLWVSCARIEALLADPAALMEPTTFHDVGGYRVIVDGHHREAARRIDPSAP